MINAIIETAYGDELLSKLFLKEELEIKNNRASVKVQNKKILIEASDATALRATMNSCLKVLQAYEKMQELTK